MHRTLSSSVSGVLSHAGAPTVGPQPFWRRFTGQNRTPKLGSQMLLVSAVKRVVSVEKKSSIGIPATFDMDRFVFAFAFFWNWLDDDQGAVLVE